MKAPSYTMHRLATDESARRAVVDAVRRVPNGELEDLERAIAAYESKYSIRSEDVAAAIESGTLRATYDVERWMMALRVRDDLTALKSKAR